ncbi:MAG TPA: PIN domain-containing protein [Thermoanaerobaculia bacterium]|nr:PIN domain-containing protein [Thermoanaerobaculia bacterium]
MSADFLDSNIFIYLFDETDERRREIARRLIHEGIESGDACISFQVVQETLAVLTGKLKKQATPAEARHFLAGVLAPLWRVMPSPALYARGLELRERYAFGFYDALIVAAAIEGGCTRLWSEDMQNGLRVDRLTIRNPFAEPSA